MKNFSQEKEVHFSVELEANAIYKASRTVGGTKLTKLKKNDDESELVKIKIDSQVYRILATKKKREETVRMAVERAILTMS